MVNEQPRSMVVVTDIRMPFLSMVVFRVKWAIAAIPAMLILMVFGGLAWATLVGLVLSAVLTGRPTPNRVTATSSPSMTSTAVSSAGNVPSAPESAYLPKVIVRGVTVEATALGGKGVFGEVKNAGERPLDKVEITIYCLDKTGARVFEKTYHPVLVSELSFGTDNTPLKPGYSRKFGVKLDDAPSEWSGKVEVQVTHVEFGKGGA